MSEAIEALRKAVATSGELRTGAVFVPIVLARVLLSLAEQATDADRAANSLYVEPLLDWLRKHPDATPPGDGIDHRELMRRVLAFAEVGWLAVASELSERAAVAAVAESRGNAAHLFEASDAHFGKLKSAIDHYIATYPEQT